MEKEHNSSSLEIFLSWQYTPVSLNHYCPDTATMHVDHQLPWVSCRANSFLRFPFLNYSFSQVQKTRISSSSEEKCTLWVTDFYKDFSQKWIWKFKINLKKRVGADCCCLWAEHRTITLSVRWLKNLFLYHVRFAGGVFWILRIFLNKKRKKKKKEEKRKKRAKKVFGQFSCN